MTPSRHPRDAVRRSGSAGPRGDRRATYLEHSRLSGTSGRTTEMVGHRAGLALILCAALAACATSPAPSQPQPQPQAQVPSGPPQTSDAPDVPSLSTMPDTPSPSSTASPRATPGPLTVKEAGAAFLAVQNRYIEATLAAVDKVYLDSAGCALDGDSCTKTEMRAGKQYWAAITARAGHICHGVKGDPVPRRRCRPRGRPDQGRRHLPSPRPLRLEGDHCGHVQRARRRGSRWVRNDQRPPRGVG